VIEHNSRKCLSLVTLKDKTSITILRKLLDILEYHPKPQFIRSDNELCFNSKLIKFGLWFLGIEKKLSTSTHLGKMAESKDSLAH
jgi:putative transposase